MIIVKRITLILDGLIIKMQKQVQILDLQLLLILGVANFLENLKINLTSLKLKQTPLILP